MSLAQQRLLTVLFLLALVAVIIFAFAMYESGHLMNGILHSITDAGTDVISRHP